MSADWETVTVTTVTKTSDLITDLTQRLAVPGGWLYRTIRNPLHVGRSASNGVMDVVTMVFVPWDDETEKKETRAAINKFATAMETER